MAQLWALLGLGLLLPVVTLAAHVIYNLFFHPLRKYPGPLLFRATKLGFVYKVVTGTIPFDVLELHEKYGDVVRIAPDQLAYTSAQAYQDIMGHHGSQAAEMQKYNLYYRPVPQTQTHIINANREEHAGLRRALAHGFSERRIREQQPIIKRYIDLFVERLKEKGTGGSTPMDMVTWYNYALFDVIGDLAFGEPFGCLESSDYHPWVRSFFQMAQAGTFLYGVSHWPMIQKLVLRMVPKKTVQEQVQVYMMAVKMLTKRMQAEDDRPDMIQALLDKKEKLGLTTAELEANSSTLVAAGSETAATTLSGLTYYLLKNPEKLEKLKDEVRGAFQSDEEIDFSSIGNLPYLRACVDEGLRIYPPTPNSLPRTVPEGGAMICGQYVPGNTVVSIYQWAIHHSTKNWTAPDEFHPERFLDDPRFEGDNRDAFQAFHVGPRACLGKNLAYLEMRTILARLVWNFDMKLAPDSRDWMSGQKVFDIWKKDALNVYLTPVSRQ